MIFLLDVGTVPTVFFSLHVLVGFVLFVLSNYIYSRF